MLPELLSSAEPLAQREVLIHGNDKTLPDNSLLRTLESALSVRFQWAEDPELGDKSDLVFESRADSSSSANTVSSSFTIPFDKRPITNLSSRSVAIKFADSPEVPFPFRNRCLSTKVETIGEALFLRQDEEGLASTESGPVWSLSIKGRAKHFRSAFMLPAIPEEGSLFDVLNGERFLELLPFLHWIKTLGGNATYNLPLLRACFIFDDPNLHWPRYGYVDFERIGAQAERENYHVAFAMIPLDTWYTHESAANVFKRNTKTLSLLVHGNNHTRDELARAYSPAARVEMLQDAIRRIQRFERNSGLNVSKIMVPPHGACSEDMLSDLPKCGFEAACISHGSLRAHNRSCLWTRSLGYSPTETIQDCPVLPRWAIGLDNENTILLAAFLRQPIILRGHHCDLKDGFDLLDGPAGIINNLGDVKWCNMTDVSRLNYAWRLDGTTLRLKPLAARLTVIPPEGAEMLLIESETPARGEVWQLSHNGSSKEVRSNEILALRSPRRCIDLAKIIPPITPYDGGRSASFAPIIRRLLTESRDRFVGSFGL